MNDVIELESIPTKIKYKGIVWIPENSIKKNNSKGCVKQNYFSKWMHTKNVGDIVTLEQFYKSYPKHKTDLTYHNRLVSTISKLIDDKTLQQLDKKSFKVLK